MVVESLRLADCQFCGRDVFMDGVVSWRQLSGYQVGVVVDCGFCLCESKFVLPVEVWGELVSRWESQQGVLKLLVDEFCFDVERLVGVDEFLLFARECRFFEGDDFGSKKCGCGRCGR